MGRGPLEPIFPTHTFPEVYHTTFDWPTDETVLRNLKKPDGLSEAETSRRLLEYHRNYYGILQSFGEQMKLINADQPCPDVFLQGRGRIRRLASRATLLRQEGGYG